jgi:hypothetical protein
MTAAAEIITYTGRLVTEECCRCHTVFAMPDGLQGDARERPDVWFYCPLGHKQHYEVGEIAKLKQKLEREQRRRKDAEATAVHYHDQATAAERSKRAYKGQLTKEHKRIGNGVCPCCNRHFANVERHMAGQHPDYAGSEAAGG